VHRPTDLLGAAGAASAPIPAPSGAPAPAVSAPEVWNGCDVVIVQDWIGSLGGAELVVKELATLFPHAPILTLFAVPQTVRKLGIDPARVRQSYLGRLPDPNRFRKFLVPWFADAVQTLDVGDAALIVSASHAVAKGVPHRSYQRHLSYVYTPVRYAHDLMPQYLRQAPALLRPWLRGALRDLATWDVSTAPRVTRYAAISHAVAERIWTTYRRRATVLHPPVDVDRIPCAEGARGDYYVALSRLVENKRIDIAVEAAVRAGRRLVVIGDGPERLTLERLASRLGGTALVDFVGRVPDAEKYRLLGGARALLFPGEEDFGIVGVEALAAGTPVVAFGRAGMLDVLDAKAGPVLGGPPRVEPAGVAFGRQSAEDLAAAMVVLERIDMPPAAELRAHALRFATPVFRRGLLRLAERTMRRP
jgi:glycosyltransferase involved in cell wall biosynthesis